MSEAGVREVRSADELRSGPANRWRIFRLVLVGLWLLCAATAVALHERSASLAEFYAAVAAGDVDRVTISGHDFPPGEGGYATRVLQWREGWFRETVTVVEVGGGSDGPELGRRQGETTRDDVAEELARTSSDVEVVTGVEMPSRTEVGGFLVPGWLGVVGFFVFLAVLFLLVNGPEPWRGTRWAWFWLSGVPVLSLLFLVWSGPTPGVRPPRDPYRRWTGGPAFLVGVVLLGAWAVSAG